MDANYAKEDMIKYFELLRLQYPLIYNEIKYEYKKLSKIEKFFHGWDYIIKNKIYEISKNQRKSGASGILEKIRFIDEKKRYGNIKITVEIIDISMIPGGEIQFIINQAVAYVMK